ncbi:MAG: sarcosine oxidase subunit delta [Chloroflexota bacterium]
MLLINCPYCGERNISDLRYGGEYNPRPKNLANFDEVSDAEAADFIYMKDNKWGVQKEWWYCRQGCQAWFLAERHTRTNEIIRTYEWESEK